MYWVYYPDLRPILVKHEVYNPRNDAVRLTWEDLFEARMFQSFIMKESNVHDRRIQEYATGIDQLFESDRIKQEMFEFEHDLWTY
jgi:gliding motility associated protien GldN